MTEGIVDSRVLTGINNPAISEAANLPKPLQLESLRTVAATTREQAQGMVARDETSASEREQREAQKKRLQLLLEGLGGGGKEKAERIERFTKLSAEHTKAAEEAILRETEIRESIGLLTPEEQSSIVTERVNDAMRVQTIAIGITIAKKLEEQGIDSKEWGTAYTVANTISKGEDGKRKIIENIIEAFKRGNVTIEPDDYKKASSIYDQWVQRLAGDVENMLSGSNMRKFSAIGFNPSLNAMGDPTKLAAEGVTGGNWFSQ